MNHTVKVLLEAEAYDGPSLIIAYSHCIAHGYQHDVLPCRIKRCVQCDSGHLAALPLPPGARSGTGENPMVLDHRCAGRQGGAAKITCINEESLHGCCAESKIQSAGQETASRSRHKRRLMRAVWRFYQHMASLKQSSEDNE